MLCCIKHTNKAVAQVLLFHGSFQLLCRKYNTKRSSNKKMIKLRRTRNQIIPSR